MTVSETALTLFALTRCSCGKLVPTTSSSSRCSNCHNSSYSLRALTTPFTGRWFCGKEIHCLHPTTRDNFQCPTANMTAQTATGIKTVTLTKTAAHSIHYANTDYCKEDIIGLEIAFREAIREKSNKILSDQGPGGEYEAAMNLFTTTSMTLIHMSLSPITFPSLLS